MQRETPITDQATERMERNHTPAWPKVVPAETARTLELEVTRLRAKLAAADQMAQVCDNWIQTKQIDSRSALADARLKYGKPFEYEFTSAPACEGAPIS